MARRHCDIFLKGAVLHGRNNVEMGPAKCKLVTHFGLIQRV